MLSASAVAFGFNPPRVAKHLRTVSHAELGACRSSISASSGMGILQMILSHPYTKMVMKFCPESGIAATEIA
jgi:hypothetical protein